MIKKFFIIISILLIINTSAFAQSKYDLPTLIYNLPPIEQGIENPEGHNINANEYMNNSTKSIPPFIENSPPKNLQAPSYNESGQHENESSPKWTDIVVAVFTIVLACVSIFQGIQLCRTVTAMKEGASSQSREMRNAIDAIESTAYAARESASAAKLSAEYLINAERPHALAIDFKMQGFYGATPAERMYGDEVSFPSVNFKIKNFGKTPIRIKNINSRFVILPILPEIPDYGISVSNEGCYIIAPDTAIDVSIHIETAEHKITQTQRNEIISRNKNLFVYGFIEYIDTFKQIRKSGYAWKYVVGGGIDLGKRFEPAGSPAYWEETQQI